VNAEHENSSWWTQEEEERFSLDSKYEAERDFLVGFGNWFTWFLVDLVLLLESIHFVFRFLNRTVNP